MYSDENLRGFITERLAAAAEDIFLVFKRTVVEYEEELQRQRKLLENVLKPHIYLNKIDVPHSLVCKEEEHLSDQDGNSSPDQEELKPPQIKEKACRIQEGEQLEPKQEAELFMLTLNHDENDHNETELQHELQLFSHNSHIAENQEPTGSSPRDLEPNPSNIIHQSSHNTDVSENYSQDQSSFKCNICGVCFEYKTSLQTHQRIHKGKEIHTCGVCGKMFSWKSLLTVHLRNHTGERPCICKTCGKGFLQISDLKKHNIMHTGERPFICTFCGKSCGLKSDLKVHIRTHTGERPYSCSTCGKSFFRSTLLNVHKRIHTGNRHLTCSTCGKNFRSSRDFKKHMEQIHLGERPHACSTCGQRFYQNSELTRHFQTHASENSNDSLHKKF